MGAVGGTTLTLAVAMAGGPTAPCALHSYFAESSFLACLITNTERLLESKRYWITHRKLHKKWDDSLDWAIPKKYAR